MELARSLFEERDQRRLLTLLRTGQEETRIAVAEYLGTIGDESALPALQALAESWQGTGENPFQKSMEAVKSRLVEEPEVEAMPPISKVTESNLAAPEKVLAQMILKGVVRDEAGSPVEAVRVWGQSFSANLRLVPLAQETLTDGQGRFSLAVSEPVGREILYFDHPDYAMAWVNNLKTLVAAVPQKDLDMTLHSPVSVAGVVKDLEGLPIHDAAIEATVEFMTDQGSTILFLFLINGMADYTDSQGAFEIGRLPEQSRLHLKVSCKTYGLYSTQRGYHASQYPILAGDQTLEIVLEPGGFIHGQIIYEDGGAYTDPAVIMLETDDVQESFFHTDEEGRFTTTGLVPGAYRLHAMGSGKLLSMPLDVQVDLHADGTEAIVLIRQSRSVQVRIIEETTQGPLLGIYVYATSSDGAGQAIASGSTDVKGLCELNLPPGQYVIQAQGWQAGRIHHFTQEVTVLSDSKDLSVEIQVSGRPVIRGWLIDRDGLEVQGSVQIMGDTHATDAKGGFAIPEPFGGPMMDHLCYALDQTGKLGVSFFWKKSAQTDDLILVLEPLATVTGRVVDSAGNGLSNIKPELWSRTPSGGWQNRSMNPWKLTVGQDGIFVFANIPVGIPLDVHAEKPGFQGNAEVGDLIGGQTLDAGDVILRGLSGVDETTDWTGLIKGRVIDEEGKPVAGYEVNTSIGTTQYKDTTDRKGRFTLKGLPLGKRMRVGLYVPGYGHCSQNVTPDEINLEMQIFPQGWDLLGKEAPPLQVSRWFNRDSVTLTQLEGQVVLLQIGVLLPNYSQDMLLLKRLFDQYSGEGLEIIAVHQPLSVTWAGKVTESDIEQYLVDQPVPYTFCLDKGRSNGETYRQYDVKATPALYLIDKRGNVRISPTRDGLEAWIKQLLAE